MQVLANVVLHKVDAEKDDPDLAREHEVGSYPTYVLMNQSGDVLDRWSGYTKDDFIDLVSVSVTDLTTIDEKTARFHENPTARDARTLARYHDSRGEYVQTVGLYRQAQELDPDTDYAMDIFDAVFYGARRGEEFTFEDTRDAADAVLASTQTSTMDVLTVASMMAYASSNADQPELMIPYLEAAFERSEGDESERVVSARSRLEPLHALYVDQDAERAVSLKRASMDEGWTEEPGGLNEFAWWCFQHRVHLDEALTLARKGIDLAAAGREKAMILDTAAEICNQLDDCQDAVDLMRQAIEEDPENEYYKEQLVRFEERLAQMGGES